jgi:hypothetical protein
MKRNDTISTIVLIHPPEIALIGDEVEISARFTLEKPIGSRPERLWFRYPAAYQNFISQRSDAFAVAGMWFAMVLHEPLMVQGVVSPHLAYGLEEYQKAYHTWAPAKYPRVDMRFEQLEPARPAPEQTAVATAFSGGVDSSFTVMTHLPAYQPLPAYQLTHYIFIHGFDIPLQDVEDYQGACRAFEQELGKLNLKLIACRTNIHHFAFGLVQWSYYHGIIQVGAALALDRLIRLYYIPSSYSVKNPKKADNWPYLYNILSTEALAISHDGSTSSRFEKATAIAGWEPAQHYLRVCVNRGKRLGVQNCSQCEKCQRTMTMFKMLDEVQNFKTFRQPYHWSDTLKWRPDYHGAVPSWFDDLSRLAWKRKQYGMLLLLIIGHIRALARYWFDRLLPERLHARFKPFFYPPEKDPFNPRFLSPDQW